MEGTKDALALTPTNNQQINGYISFWVESLEGLEIYGCVNGNRSGALKGPGTGMLTAGIERLREVTKAGD